MVKSNSLGAWGEFIQLCDPGGRVRTAASCADAHGTGGELPSFAPNSGGDSLTRFQCPISVLLLPPGTGLQ